MVAFNPDFSRFDYRDLPLSELPAAWRAEAEFLKRWPGNEGPVVALQRAADALERSIKLYEEEELTLEQAAEESGYSVDHLGRVLREKPQFNSGDKGRPRVRRRDLRKLVKYKKPELKLRLAANRPSDNNPGGLFRDIINTKFGG